MTPPTPLYAQRVKEDRTSSCLVCEHRALASKYSQAERASRSTGQNLEYKEEDDD